MWLLIRLRKENQKYFKILNVMFLMIQFFFRGRFRGGKGDNPHPQIQRQKIKIKMRINLSIDKNYTSHSLNSSEFEIYASKGEMFTYCCTLSYSSVHAIHFAFPPDCYTCPFDCGTLLLFYI